MARLADYGINVNDLSNVRNIVIKGITFPVVFSMETMEYIADVYGGDYSIFESSLNDMLRKKDGTITTRDLTPADLKIMRALIYGMLRTGGLEDKPDDIFKFLGMGDEVLKTFGVCMEIFSNQTFQVQDLKKSREPQDFQRKSQKHKRKNKKPQAQR